MSLLACESIVRDIIDRGDIEMIIVFGVGGTIALVAILACTISGVFKTRAREVTRRELAAYVAEGSISPEDAVAMLNAGGTASERAVQANMRRMHGGDVT